MRIVLKKLSIFTAAILLVILAALRLLDYKVDLMKQKVVKVLYEQYGLALKLDKIITTSFFSHIEITISHLSLQGTDYSVICPEIRSKTNWIKLYRGNLGKIEINNPDISYTVNNNLKPINPLEFLQQDLMFDKLLMSNAQVTFLKDNMKISLPAIWLSIKNKENLLINLSTSYQGIDSAVSIEVIKPSKQHADYKVNFEGVNLDLRLLPLPRALNNLEGIRFIKGILSFNIADSDFRLKSLNSEVIDANYLSNILSCRIKYNDKWEISNLSYFNSNLQKSTILIDNIIFDSERGLIKFDNTYSTEFNVSLNDSGGVIKLKKMPTAVLHNKLKHFKLDRKLESWLKMAIQSGILDESELLFKYQGHKVILDELNIKLSNFSLKYDESWPIITDIDGTLKLIGNKMVITANTGKINGEVINKTVATIEDWTLTDPILKIDASINSRLEKGLVFIQNSPLKNKIGMPLSYLAPQGDMQLKLNLIITLDVITPTKVFGALQFENAKIDLAKVNEQITDVKGTVFFTEKTITSDSIVGNFLKEKLKINKVFYDTHGANNKVTVSGDFFIPAGFIKRHFLHGIITQMVKIDGKANIDFSFMLPIEKSEIDLYLDSKLENMSIKIMDENIKKNKELLNMHAHYYINTINPIEQKFSINLGNKISAKLKLHNNGSIKSGNIAFSDNSSWLDDGLLLSGHLTKLVTTNFINSFKDSASSIKTKLNLLVDNLNMSNVNLSNVNIKSDVEDAITLTGPDTEGRLSFSKNKILLNFNRLNLTTKMQDVTQKSGQYQYPDLEFIGKDVVFNNKKFGAINFTAVNQNGKYNIMPLTINNNAFTLDAGLEWDYKSIPQQSSFNGKIKASAVKDLLNLFGMQSALTAGDTQIKFNLNFFGTLFNLDFTKASGTVNAFVTQGRILGIEPGLGRLLNLLNIESISRRIQLDFSDVLNHGFAFNTLECMLNFNNSEAAEIKQLILESHSSIVKIQGKFNLKTKEIQADMWVNAKVTGSIPVVATIATGNPALGAVIWVVDRSFSSKKQDGRYHYNITGTLEQPKITEIK